MLEAASLPVNKTYLMYVSRLSYSQLRVYLRLLQKTHLLTYDRGGWICTEKGRQYVSAYSMMTEILPADVFAPVSSAAA